MFEVYTLLFVCTAIAIVAEGYNIQRVSDGYVTNENDINGKILLFILFYILIWFSGTRTRMNDTTSYLYAFSNKTPSTINAIKDINWAIGNNPLFQTYMIIVKTFISSNGQVFLLVTSFLVVLSMGVFLYRYSWSFGESVFLFIATMTYAFTMAAMKQSMATAIGIWAIPLFSEKKYLKGILLIAIAMLFHPYVFVLLAALLYANGNIWDRTTLTLIGFTVIICVMFSQIINGLTSFTALFGDIYEEEWFAEGTGSSGFRVLTALLFPLFTYIYRKELREENNPLLNMFINISIVSACFSIIAGFGGTILIGRIPSYFGIFQCISYPYVLSQGTKRDINNNQWKIIIYVFFILFYSASYRKYFVAWNVGMWDSVYNRVPLYQVLFGG